MKIYLNPTPHKKLNTRVPRRGVCAHNTSEGIEIGEAERFVAEVRGAPR
jgi:hypothetical protein